jgi:hypothetical protein
MRRAVFLAVLLVVATAVSAQTYKWKDASGGTQYSDTPPPPGAKDVQQIRQATGATAPPAVGGAQQKTIAEQEAEFRKRLESKKEADAKQAKAENDEQVRARNCAQATNQLKAYDIGTRMTRVNDKGERITLSDAEREQAKAEAQKAVDTWCK